MLALLFPHALTRQVNLLGVCLASPIMIVQELVPLGALVGGYFYSRFSSVSFAVMVF